MVGAPFRLSGVDVNSLRDGVAVMGQSFTPREIEVVQFLGRLYLFGRDGETGRQRLVSLLHPDTGAMMRFDTAEVVEAAHRAMLTASVVGATWLEDYDAYYYDRSGTQALPVLRVRYDDPQETLALPRPISRWDRS